MGSDKRVSRTERSGRYGSIVEREDRDEREPRSRRRDEYKRCSEERRGERYEDYRDYDSRDYDSRDYDSRDSRDCRDYDSRDYDSRDSRDCRDYDSRDGRDCRDYDSRDSRDYDCRDYDSRDCRDYDSRDSRDYDRDYDSRDYDSPERERERRNSDKSEDGYHSDGDYGEHDYRNDINDEKESKTIMLRGLPITVTENDIRELIESFEGPQPADVRLMKRKTGVSRGFAFVEFYHFQDATSWMEANQKKLVIQGKQIAMHYSNPRPKFEDWLCNKCCLYNFRRRLKCFRCGADKFDSEQEVPPGTAEAVQSVDYYCDTIILRNIAPHTVVESIMTALSPYASLAVNNIRLIKDKQTQQNRGFAFVQLSSAMDASQLLQILQSLQPPLKIDGKTIGVDFAKSARKDLLLPDGNRVSAFSVASTAIAAAQWSSTQPQTGEGSTLDYSYLQSGQDGYTQYTQYSQDYQQYYQNQGGVLDSDAATISGAPVTTTTAAVVSQSPQLYNQQTNSPDSPTQAAPATTSTQAQTAAPTGVVPGTKYAVPDTSTYQYDESSGYYYDPVTGLYYDPNSQYYYNALTQQYLYWDGEKETYMPAAEGITYQQTATTTTTKEVKEKKEKPKSKTAQQIAKDMERWAKSLNKQKENFKNSFQPLSTREEERKESAAADAGFALFEKKGALSERQQILPEVMKNGEDENPLKRGLVAAYSGDSDNDEDLLERMENEEEKLTDWKKMACLLCRRQFPNKDALIRHQQLSDLHKQNMDIYRRSKLSEQELEALELREREVLDMDTEDDPLLQDAWLDEEDEEVAFSSRKRRGGALLCGKSSCKVRPLRVTLPVSGFWNIVGWIFTNPYCAGFILFLGCAIPAVLAVVMFLHYPALDIDISYNAFEIRNHESSQRFDALALALKSQFGSWGRNRRDLADFTSETLQRLIFEQLQQLHLNASHLQVSTRAKRSTPQSRMSSPEPRAHLHPGNETSRVTRGAPRWDYSNTYISANTQTHAHWRIELIFLARGDSENNIFTTERLVTIHEVERKIMDHPRFREFCWKPHEVLKDLPLGSYSYCSPPSSLMTYFFPTERGGKIYYDGMGQDLADIQGSLELAMTHPEFYWYVDEGLSAENKKSSLLRSEILFGAPLPNYYSVEDRWEEQRHKFQNFVVTYVAMLAKQSTSKVQVLYGGTDLFDYEVRRTFNNDMLLAFISSSCIAVLVYILTSCSVFLSFFGIASIGLSCLVALFLYHVVFGIQYLGILNGVAAFVIVGIGVDDVFVFINTYRQATHLKDLRLRMIHTIQTAGKATFFTSLTTAAAYAANIFSQIPAVHDFGLFMSLIVSCCWVAVLFTMPAALGIWTLYVSPLESSCQTSCSQKCTKKSTLHLAEDLFIASEGTSGAGQETLPYLDDDIPLLSVEEEPVSLEMGDVPLVSVMPENLQLPVEKSNRGHLIAHLQELLEHWVLWSAVKSRWVIVGLFLLVLLLSIFFASRLRPASRAPVLFRPDTNIQVLLDLKYNLSAEGISCITCSGLFQEKPHSLQNNFRTSLEKKKRGSGSPWGSKGSISDTGQQDLQGTVYISKSRSKGRPAIYRFSLNASIPAPWQMVSPGDGEVPSFQVYRVPFGNFTRKLTACVSTVGLLKQTSPRKWMMTTLSCDSKRGWKFDFSFYVAAKEQQRTRKLYFAQSHKPPYHGRVCVAPPGCLLSSSPDGPTKGILYVPSEKAAPKARLSATSGFNPCMNMGCGKPAVRPLVDTGAMVFVVFGIRGVNRTKHSDNHVIGDMGSVIYDDSFDLFKEIGNLCRLCKAIASNTELVKPGGAQCLPSGYSISSFLQMLHPECKNIPEPNLLPGQLSHGAVGVKDGKVQWISMAFESTTYKGKSSFQTYADYLKWETFLQQQLQLFPEGSALRRGFQTCEHWKQIFMEIIGVQSALYGLILSLVICVAAVAVFTTHILLLLPVLLSILGVVCLVVTIMYWSGWEMGAVEAISLSILVGSSVDYCVHLVEGYLLAGENLPLHHAEDPTACRQWRTIEAIRHVGVAIVSSAVTTVIATVPLFFCIIAPFAKFGKIVALNTGVSILYTLTVSTALLSIMGPGTFTRSRTSCLKAVAGVLLTGLLGLCICLALLKGGFKIPLPNGTAL